MSEPIQPKGIPIKIGPFKVEWESNLEQEKVDIIAKLGDPSRIFTLGALQQLCADDWGGLADLSNWAEWKYRIKGQTHFAVTELALAADRILQARHAYLPNISTGRTLAMTINQAKNREFEGVMVLWPFATGGDLESQRRRLYNALTRAQKWAVVIVQEDPKDPRVAKSPFSKLPTG